MNLGKIKDILRADIIVASSIERKIEIEMICACDLMSDVLSCIQIASRPLLLTNLTHSQTIRTADVSEIPVICFVRGRKPENQVIELAEKNNIILLSTPFSLYEASGRLYREGIPGCSEYREKK